MRRKNVLLITMDQWPGSAMGCAENPTILTPTLDELSACGIRYTSAYSTTPVCIPARRELMTGTSARTHGDRCQTPELPMPPIKTLADMFGDAGYQTYAVGKLHVYPQRDRIGFDDVILYEEGRRENGEDDYEHWLSENGYYGMAFAHGMCNNNYMYRPFHLPERFHPTNWAAAQMCEQIRRKDPTRPAFWYLSFAGPHPPLTPLRDYLDLYRDRRVEDPYVGEWAREGEDCPRACRYYQNLRNVGDQEAVSAAIKAYYAGCTQIDHQIRLVIGTLREHGLLRDTVILITADHGDMLGNHGIWCKNLFYEDSCRIPFILVPTEGTDFNKGSTDSRLVELRDVMPTLAELAGVPIPGSCEGISVLSEEKRSVVYGELWDDERLTRMVTDGEYKMIYYGCGNQRQLFHLKQDPRELRDLSRCEEHRERLKGLEQQLIGHLYGEDRRLAADGKLIGMEPVKGHNFKLGKRGLLGQRGMGS